MLRNRVFLPGAFVPFCVAACALLVGCGSGSRRAADDGEIDAGDGLVGGGANPGTSFMAAQLNFPPRGPRRSPAAIERAFPNLPLTKPLFLTHANDGTKRIFVLEQDGRVVVFPRVENVAQTKTFLDLTARIQRVYDEEGLLGLAFAPDYKTSGQLYVHYTLNTTPPQNVISRFTVSATDPDRADPLSELVVMRVDQPFNNHYSGMLAFGPDQMLYIGFGDGGGGGDPFHNAQSLTSLLGKVVRIDPSGGTAAQPYRVPPDNPFVAKGNGVRGEIWAYGLRNPWRFSFEPVTGKLWVGDVGQSSREEIDIVRRGGNYGWSYFEGTQAYKPLTKTVEVVAIPPVVEYGSSLGRCVIGGYVYRGAAVPALRGQYVYGDLGSGRAWSFQERDGRAGQITDLGSVPNVCSFGEDEDGELYAVAFSGELHRFTVAPYNGEGARFPQRLSQTGLFLDTATLQPAIGVVPYDVNAPFWSDGAKKTRYIAPSAPRSITFHPTEAWDLATGSVVVKHFEIEMIKGLPSSARRLETRVLIRELDGWAGYTYRWNERQDDADLLGEATVTEELEVRDGPDRLTTKRQTWEYPARSACMFCHNAAAGRVLSVRARQINRDIKVGTTRMNQIDLWNALGLFTAPVGAGNTYQAYVNPADRAASLDERARVYLGVNCAPCHNPGTVIPGAMDLRYGVPLPATNTVNVLPTHGNLNLPNPRIISPRMKVTSVLWERVRRLDDYRMPVLGSHALDPIAVEMLGQWIDSM